jgi:hypothetical protein
MRPLVTRSWRLSRYTLIQENPWRLQADLWLTARSAFRKRGAPLRAAMALAAIP